MPAITIGLRGMMYAQIDVVGTAVDLHSGGYGGAVQNPANALARIIAASRTRTAGSSSRASTTTSSALIDDERAHDRGAAVRRGRPTSLGSACPALYGEAGYTTLERRGARPTLDVNGMWGGFQGEGSKTIIPAHAHAKISCRLVAGPGSRPDLRGVPRPTSLAIAPPGVRVDVRCSAAAGRA